MWLLNWSAKSDRDAVTIWSGDRPALGPPRTGAVQLVVVAGSITKWLPSLLTQSENGPASTAGRLETLDVLLPDSVLRSSTSERAGRHFSPTETWGLRVWVAALPHTAFLPFRSLSSVPFPASICQAVSRAVAAGNNAQVSRLHQPELTSGLCVSMGKMGRTPTPGEHEHPGKSYPDQAQPGCLLSWRCGCQTRGFHYSLCRALMWQVALRPPVPYLALGCILEGFVPGPGCLGGGFSHVGTRCPALPTVSASEAASGL